MQEANHNPLDVGKFKEAVRSETERLKIKPDAEHCHTSFTLALALSAAVKKVFFEKTGMKFSNEPNLEKRPVVQFVKRMRVDAMEKFNAPTVFSAVDFAGDEEALKRQEYLMTLVVYQDRKLLAEFLRMLQYPFIDSDDDQEAKDACGTLVNLIGGQYKREMQLLGYEDLTMSHFRSYINSVEEGLDIPTASMDKYELSFEVDGKKSLVVEMVVPALLQKQLVRHKKITKRVLVVDDDRGLIKAIQSLLESKGFEVVVAYDGKEGMDKLKQKPNLIILDMQMPNMNGFEFILAMQEMPHNEQVPIAVLTSMEGLDNIVNVGVVREYQIKPFVPDKLLACVLRHIR